MSYLDLDYANQLLSSVSGIDGLNNIRVIPNGLRLTKAGSLIMAPLLLIGPRLTDTTVFTMVCNQLTLNDESLEYALSSTDRNPYKLVRQNIPRLANPNKTITDNSRWEISFVNRSKEKFETFKRMFDKADKIILSRNIATYFTENGCGFRKFEHIDLYLKQNGIDAYTIGVENKNSLEVVTYLRSTETQNQNEILLRKTLALLPAIFNKYFVDSGMTEPERKLLDLLGSNDDKSLNEHIEQMWVALDIQGSLLRNGLKSFFGETKYKKKIDHIERRMVDLSNSIKSYSTQIASLTNELEELAIESNAFKEALHNDDLDAELERTIEFFKNNKSVRFIKSDPNIGNIEFYVNTTLEDFNTDLAEDYYENTRSVFYWKEHYHSEEPSFVFKGARLMKAIFIDRTIKVRMGARFDLDTVGNITGNSIYIYDADTHIYNPHLVEYNCFGNSQVDLIKYCRNADWIRAVSFCIRATGNLSMRETTNVSNLIDYIFEDSDKKCLIIADTGELVSANEAIKYIEEEENNE